MIDHRQRSVAFILISGAFVSALAVEVYLLVSMVQKDPAWINVVAPVLGGGMLAFAFKFFIEMARKAFMADDLVSGIRFQKLASERCEVLVSDSHAPVDEYERRRRLVTVTLRFAEERLRTAFGGTHFELCVFMDEEEPLLFAYYDSQNEIRTKSMSRRTTDPTFYTTNGYEAAKFVSTRSSQPRIIARTVDDPAYRFMTEMQRQQIRSSILYCVDVEKPIVLVISSNKDGDFSKYDLQVAGFLHAIGQLVRFDLLDDGFVDRLRSSRPGMFTAIGAPGTVSLPVQAKV